MKKFLMLFLCLALLFTATAFAGGSKEKADSQAEYKIPKGTKPAGTVTFWHAMSGSRQKVIDKLVSDFNAKNPAVKVEALYTGSYDETVTKGLAAVKAGNPPVLLMSYEVGTQTMKDSGAIIPVKNLNQGHSAGPRGYMSRCLPFTISITPTTATEERGELPSFT